MYLVMRPLTDARPTEIARAKGAEQPRGRSRRRRYWRVSLDVMRRVALILILVLLALIFLAAGAPASGVL
jgi:uncharacterized membrane protein YhaH (DUF805 family)